MNKIKFKDLSLFLKISAIFGFAWFVIAVCYFLAIVYIVIMETI